MAPLDLLCSLFILLASSAPTYQESGMSCAYGARGSLTSTCVNANPMYFRTTSYRFDNLDETVQCSNCVLTTIDSNTFDISGNQIKTLNLNSSKIVTLRPKAFIGLVFLKRLLLADNMITKVPPETFMGINKVRELDIRNNQITELVANGFKELTNLRLLNLSNNKISSVENGSFTGLASLEELDMSNNNIETLDGLFTGLLNIGSINLENNKIGRLGLNNIPELDSLLYLNLARNRIPKVESNAVLSLIRLETLNLSSNPITAIDVNAFRGLNAVEKLDLSNCSISALPKGVLYSLRRLRELSLSNNTMTTFATGTFSGIPELRTLNLSHNKIETYKKTGVFALHSLHTLDLSFNKLKYLDYKQLVDHMPRLAYIQMNDNPWPCYLGKEMEDYFKHDNLEYVLGKEYDDPKLVCKDARPADLPKEDSNGTPSSEAATAKFVSVSNGHEYVLYVFICVSLAMMAGLFYLVYKNQRDIRHVVGSANISEQQLLTSSDLNARDDY